MTEINIAQLLAELDQEQPPTTVAAAAQDAAEADKILQAAGLGHLTSAPARIAASTADQADTSPDEDELLRSIGLAHLASPQATSPRRIAASALDSQLAAIERRIDRAIETALNGWKARA